MSQFVTKYRTNVSAIVSTSIHYPYFSIICGFSGRYASHYEASYYFSYRYNVGRTIRADVFRLFMKGRAWSNQVLSFRLLQFAVFFDVIASWHERIKITSKRTFYWVFQFLNPYIYISIKLDAKAILIGASQYDKALIGDSTYKGAPVLLQISSFCYDHLVRYLWLHVMEISNGLL